MFSNCLVYYFCVLFIQLVFNCVVASDKLDKASIVFPELNIPPKSNLKNDRTSDITDGIDELTRASNAFSLDYFHKISRIITSKNNSNVVVSPFSLWSLLFYITEGSSGQTYEQLANILQLPEELTKIRNAFRDFQQIITDDSAAIELNMNQILFSDVNRPIDIGFQGKLELFYGTDIYPISYTKASQTVDEINDYIRSKTNGKIDRFIEANQLSLSLLMPVSTTIFHGKWKDSFDSSIMMQRFFNEYGIPVSDADIPFMLRKGNVPNAYSPELQSKIIELKYGDDDKFSMLLMLPDKNVPLINVIERLSTFDPDSIFLFYESHLKEYQAKNDSYLFLPRFSIQSKVKLNSVLREMGLNDLLDPNAANFSKISTHKTNFAFFDATIINVNENGITPSTSTVTDAKWIFSQDKHIIDRPFAFMVVERSTRAILLFGLVQDPSRIDSRSLFHSAKNQS